MWVRVSDRQVILLRYPIGRSSFCGLMAPHLTNQELDYVAQQVGMHKPISDIHQVLSKQRSRAGIDAPKIWAVRRAARGRTHRRGPAETRGRKRKLSSADVRRLNKVRQELQKKVKADYEVTYASMIKKAKLSVDRRTAARALKPLGVAWRRLREKPPRTAAHENARVDVCRMWARRPDSFWRDRVDMIIDCKKFPIPTSRAAVARLRQQQVRFAARTRQEGLKEGLTKPNVHRHKFNAGGHVHILAGVTGDKVTVWEEIHGRWNAAAAAAMYAGPIKKVLQKYRPGKKTWLIMEDNDPTGFKSNLAKAAKAAQKMASLNQPPYSPDLNPWDFSLWAAVQKRVLDESPKGQETKMAFKARLRRTARGLPKLVVRKAVAAIRRRAEAILAAGGKNIARD